MKKIGDLAKNLQRFRHVLSRAEREFEEDFFFEKQSQMTELMGFSWPTIRRWCNDYPELDDPKNFRRGGMGSTYAFNPRRTLKALIAIAERQAAEQIASNKELRRKIGIDLPESEQTSDLDATRKLISATFDVIDRREKQKLQVPAQDLVDFLDGFCRAVSDGIMGVDSEVDPTGQLPAQTRKLVNDALIGVAGRVHAKGQKFIEVYRARIQQGGVGN